jgi:hypothetical protein
LSSFTPGTSITAQNVFVNSGLTFFNIDINNSHLALSCGCLPNGGSVKNV